MPTNDRSKEYFFQHKDRSIELIKNELRSPESFVLKIEANTTESSAVAGKIVKFSTPVLSLGFATLTTLNFGFSFLAGGFFEKIQFSLISLLLTGVYIVPTAVLLIVIAAFISMIADRNKNAIKNSSFFVNIPEKVQEHIKAFNDEKIYEYSSVLEVVEVKKKDLKKFESLVKKVPKNFAFDKEANEKIKRMNKEILELNNMADNILENELNRVLSEEDEKNLRTEVEHRLEIQDLIQKREAKIEKEENLVQSQILFELASDDLKDISDRDNA